uniref:Laminin N-terminal domain-containing protein n=1 Tax=Macrostomum lignano TaxID=282301 RepID=A0A1I8IT47_9PLAT
MQLSKLLLFMLVACSAIQTLGAPVVRPKCELGEYPDALVDCLPCPSLEGNTEDYLKTFANQHKECPYPPPATWTATTEVSSTELHNTEDKTRIQLMLRSRVQFLQQLAMAKVRLTNFPGQS